MGQSTHVVLSIVFAMVQIAFPLVTEVNHIDFVGYDFSNRAVLATHECGAVEVHVPLGLDNTCLPCLRMFHSNSLASPAPAPTAFPPSGVHAFVPSLACLEGFSVQNFDRGPPAVAS